MQQIGTVSVQPDQRGYHNIMYSGTRAVAPWDRGRVSVRKKETRCVRPDPEVILKREMAATLFSQGLDCNEIAVCVDVPLEHVRRYLRETVGGARSRTRERDRLILAEFRRTGSNSTVLSRHFQVSEQIVRRALHKAGLGYDRRQQARRAAVIEGFRAGRTISELGQEYGYSNWGIYQILHRHGVTPTARRRERDRRILSDHESGTDPATLAARHGLTATRIRQIIASSDAPHRTDRSESVRKPQQPGKGDNHVNTDQ